jgi:NAD(P)H dehydrogenase (quinone)
MKIGVSGASGNMGLAILGYLKQRAPNAEIIGISRTPDKLTVAGVEGRFGDYNDPASLSEAYRGLDKLFLIPPTDLAPGARARQTTGAVDAAVAAGVQHLAYASSSGAYNAPKAHVLAGYFATEQAMMRKAPQWTILRMTYYQESFLQEVQHSVSMGVHAGLFDAKVNFVARDDLAAAAAGILTEPGHDGAIYYGTGPENFNGTERAALVAEVSGKPFNFVAVTEGQYADGLRGGGLPEDVVNTIVSIQSCFAKGDFNIISGDIERLAGRKPKTLRATLQEAFGG